MCWAAGTFEITQQSGLTINDGVNPEITNASLLTISLSDVYLFVGVDGAFTRDANQIVTGLDTSAALGFSVSGAALDLAILSEAAMTLPAPRSWTGIAAHVDAMTVHGLPSTLVFSVNDLDVFFNIAASDGSRINWDDLNTDGVVSGMEGLNNNLELKVLGSVTISVDQFVYITANVAFESREIFVQTVGSLTTTKVKVLAIGASDVKAFVGIGGPYWVTEADGTVRAPTETEAAGALGVTLTISALGLLLIKPVAAQGQPASTKSYFALTASGGAALVGIDSLTLAGQLNISINSASDSAAAAGTVVPVIDFAASAALNPTVFGKQ